ncbi:MAG: cytochrome c biogenesis protein [Flavobacteriales bacterium]
MIPGGSSVATTTLHPGNNEFTFTGYNTHFISEKSNLQVLVSTGGKNVYYCAQVLATPSESFLRASVHLPDTIASAEFTFYTNTLTDGTVHVTAPTTSEGFTIDSTTRQGACDFQVVSDEHIAFGFPYQPIIIESIRNLIWHVPMWFTMFVLMGISVFFSIKSLASGDSKAQRKKIMDASEIRSKVLIADLKAAAAAHSGMLFCVLGLVTGSVWARFTWGTWWVDDPQLNNALKVFLIYAAYLILRVAVPDEGIRARVSAIYSVFAFALMVVLLMVMPRFAEGLHPGKSGNPAFSKYDLDNSLRTVFYTACAGFIMLGYWIYQIKFRISKLESEHEANN